ncbi:MAG: HAD family hydrolase [Bacteroidota bacterium]
MGKAIALVPARCGSKSIPLKNIKDFCGRPLIYWTLKALNESNFVERVILATDCDTIEAIAKELCLSKVEVYRRKPENATDSASTESVMLEVIEALKVEGQRPFILVQPTSPFLTVTDVNNAMETYLSNGYDSLLTCVRVKRFFWTEEGKSINYDFTSRPRRQDFKGELMENGALYISKTDTIVSNQNRLSGNIGIYEMPEYSATEIDEQDDWIVAEALMKKHVLKLDHSGKKIKLFATDVDGVLTDAGMYYSENGDELKKFNTLDGKGIELLRNKGIKTAILTSENTAIVNRRAQKLKIDFLYQDQHNKLETLKKICLELGISLDEVAYIGDDINDREVLGCVGYGACPANAVDVIKMLPNVIRIDIKGGEGAVRAFIEHLFYINAI